MQGVPAPFEISGTWNLVLEGKEFPRKDLTVRRLVSWTDDPQTKHFSGTGRYTIAFDLPPAYHSSDVVLQLSVGDCGDVAEVELNSAPAGVIWMRGQALEVTKAARAGRNVLSIAVTNTLINRASGWSKVPELPDELKPIYGRGIDDNSPSARELFGFSPLPRSGLLGPVRLTALKRVRMNWR